MLSGYARTRVASMIPGTLTLLPVVGVFSAGGKGEGIVVLTILIRKDRLDTIDFFLTDRDVGILERCKRSRTVCQTRAR